MTRLTYRTPTTTLSLECDDPQAELEPWLATWANALDTVLGIDAAERLAPLHHTVPLVVDQTEGGPRLRISDDQEPPTTPPATCRNCGRPTTFRAPTPEERHHDPSTAVEVATGWADDGKDGVPFYCPSRPIRSVQDPAMHEPTSPPLSDSGQDHATSDDDAGPATCRHCGRPITLRALGLGEQTATPRSVLADGQGWADDGKEGLRFFCDRIDGGVVHEPAPHP